MPTKSVIAEAHHTSTKAAVEWEEEMKRLEAEKGEQLYWCLQDKAKYLGNKLPGSEHILLL